jgi:putative transposase
MQHPKKKRPEKVCISLCASDIQYLENIVKKGMTQARTITRARILLLSHQKKSNTEIMEALDCSHDLISMVRTRYCNRGSVAGAIHDAPRPGQPKKITARHEAYVIATACTDAPQGHNHWTLSELRKALLRRYKKLRTVSDERIRHILLASELKPWREKNVVCAEPHPTVS